MHHQIYQQKTKLVEVAHWDKLLPMIESNDEYRYYIADMEDDYKSEWVFHKVPVVETKDDKDAIYNVSKNVKDIGLVPLVIKTSDTTHTMEWRQIFEFEDKYYTGVK